MSEIEREKLEDLAEQLEWVSALNKELLPYQERAVKAEKRVIELENLIGIEACALRECIRDLTLQIKVGEERIQELIDKNKKLNEELLLKKNDS